MSNMLDQVIVDAEALKEVAIKNAEAAIVEKYSNDIKKAVDQLLEQGPSPEEQAMMGATSPPGTPGAPGGMDAGTGEAVGPNIPEAQMDGGQNTVTLNLSELVQEMKMDDLDPKEKQVRELVAEEVTGGEEVTGQEGEETITINESVIADILGEMLNEEELEELEEQEEYTDEEAGGRMAAQDQFALDNPGTTVRGTGGNVKGYEGIDLGGGLGSIEAETAKGAGSFSAGEYTPPPETQTPMQEQLRAYQYNYAKLYESHKAYEHNYAQLHQQAGQLHEQNNKFRQMLVKTQEKLNEVNVRNAQLHYTNRTLNSDSLNERQKDKVVEAIGKAGTVEEAKIIFETLQSAVAGARPNKETPKSLNEAINKRSSAFLPRKEEKQSDPSFADRMQRLAGIK